MNCPCGTPLHYSSPAIERQMKAMVDVMGACAFVRVLGKDYGYMVPRHYIALHGIKAWQLDELAERYGWKKT